MYRHHSHYHKSILIMADFPEIRMPIMVDLTYRLRLQMRRPVREVIVVVRRRIQTGRRTALREVTTSETIVKSLSMDRLRMMVEVPRLVLHRVARIIITLPHLALSQLQRQVSMQPPLVFILAEQDWLKIVDLRPQHKHLLHLSRVDHPFTLLAQRCYSLPIQPDNHRCLRKALIYHPVPARMHNKTCLKLIIMDHLPCQSDHVTTDLRLA